MHLTKTQAVIWIQEIHVVWCLVSRGVHLDLAHVHKWAVPPVNESTTDLHTNLHPHNKFCVFLLLLPA